MILACVRGEGGVPRDKRGTFSVHWQTQRGAALAARVQRWQVGSAQTSYYNCVHAPHCRTLTISVALASAAATSSLAPATVMLLTLLM